MCKFKADPDGQQWIDKESYLELLDKNKAHEARIADMWAEAASQNNIIGITENERDRAEALVENYRDTIAATKTALRERMVKTAFDILNGASE